MTIAAGQTCATFNIATLADTGASTDKSFSVVLTDASGAAVARTSKREYLTVLAAPDTDPTEQLNTLAQQVDGLLTNIDGKITAIDDLIDGAGGLVAIRSVASPQWFQYDAVFDTLVLRVGEAINEADLVQEKLVSAVSKSQGELFRFAGVVEYLDTLDEKLDSISGMVQTEQANLYALSENEAEWNAFQVEISRISAATWESFVIRAVGAGAVPGGAPDTVATLNELYGQMRIDWQAVLEANCSVNWDVAAMDRWINEEQLDTDPSYDNLVGDMANRVSAVAFYAASDQYTDENGNDISASAELGAAKATMGFSDDSFAMKGLQVWVSRFQSVLEWEGSLAQGQINYLTNQGYGGSANALTFEAMQGWLGSASSALGEITN